MAAFASVCSINVCRILTCGDGTVMAAYAVVACVRVFKGRIRPGRCFMAILAILATHYVVDRFACSSTTVMTSAAGSYNCSMINLGYLCPCMSGMTILTNIR